MTSVLVGVFHVTVLSNFARAYDKYSGAYDKALIPESTFSRQFFVLDGAELGIGLEKAGRLLERLAVPGNRLLVLEAQVAPAALKPNLRTGRGRYLEGDKLPLAGVHYVEDGVLLATTVEEVMAAALALRLKEMLPYAALRPRTVSVLPIALGCQAACRFCFSKTSVSADTETRLRSLTDIRTWAEKGAAAGAERFVITGGGEPGLVRHADLLALVRLGAETLGKTVLITNGVHLARKDEEARAQMLQDYAQAGLSVLSVSRHHHDDIVNEHIMGLATNTHRVMQTWRALAPAARPARLRLICVLQKGGIDSDAALRGYVDWAAGHGVTELCFKELYVSSTLESAYQANPENQWSREHQVPLALITHFFEREGFQVTARLPWGSPVYEGLWNGSRISIAAYTEPSLYWERSNGVARSWNLMASGQCLASLEDLSSILTVDSRRIFPILKA